MSYIQRLYRGPADLPLMAALAQRNRERHLRVIDLPYRFSSWAFDEVENAALWFNGELVAWAVLQAPFWTIDLAFAAGAPVELCVDVLTWADRRARQAFATPYGHACWFVNAFADDHDLTAALERAGFADQYSGSQPGDDAWSKVWMQRPVTSPVGSYRIPAGFTVRPLTGEAEIPAYVALHQETFGSKNMTIEWRRRTLAQPAYDPALDVVVEAPDGRLGAFCIGWIDRSGSIVTGQIEPLGCHPDFRRYGLGRLALAEVLHRMQGVGVEVVHVETDNYRNTALALYETMGFEVVREVHVWRKDYAG